MQAITSGIRSKKSKVVLLCSCGCETPLTARKRPERNRLHFVDKNHMAEYRVREYLSSHCGQHLSLVTSYLEGVAKSLYRDVGAARRGICPFFKYLTEAGVDDLGAVTSATILSFRDWAMQNGHRSMGKDLSFLSTFFEWLIANNLYGCESPIIPSVRADRKKGRQSVRPYSEKEIAQIRELLEKRGNERTRAFFEIACESGMNTSEIIEIKLHDLRPQDRLIKVAASGSRRQDTVAFLHDRSARSIEAWLSVRDKDCGHEYLFHNGTNSGHLCRGTIEREFGRILCNTHEGLVRHADGLESFSLKRVRKYLSEKLRLNGASETTLMAVLRVGAGSIQTLAQPTQHDVGLGYAEALSTRSEAGSSEMIDMTLTVEEFLHASQ